jgi:ubiquinone/menaquinone biosynthesis C-methylase UbiE
MATDTSRTYVLGNDPAELARLDRQAANIERPTRVVLQAAGIGRGFRVLDLGSGLGHVARLVGEAVGPEGAVVGVDQSVDALAVARRRTEEAGASNVSFIEGDVRTWHSGSPFDAIVERLLLFHMADPVEIVRRHFQNLRAGGLFVAIDFDIGACRSEPRVQLAEEAVDWIMEAFAGAGAWPRIGARLGTILQAAGLQDVTTFGVQGYIGPNDPTGPALLGGVIRSLVPTIVARGIATAEQIGIETLERRMAEELKRADAVFLPPTVVGAWGRYEPAGSQ